MNQRLYDHYTPWNPWGSPTTHGKMTVYTTPKKGGDFTPKNQGFAWGLGSHGRKIAKIV